MKKMIRRGLVSFLIFIFSLAPISSNVLLLNISHVEAINIEDVDLGNIKEKVVIPAGTKFIIEAGTLINFARERVSMEVEGELEINGTKDEPVIIKSSTYDYFAIITKPGSKVSIKNAEIIGGGFGMHLMKGVFNSAMASSNVGAIDVNGGDINISDTTFRDNEYAIITHNISGGSVKVNYSKFINNNFDVEDYSQSDFTNNYWSNIKKTTACANNHSVGDCFNYYIASGNFNIYPWQEDENFVHEEGASSVLFLPGVQSSRLYKEHLLDEDRLWEPTNRNEDVKDLYLNSDGTSIDKSIYTNEDDGVIDKAYTKIIYKDFMSYMDGLVADGTIKEWKAIPYDWRLPLEDTVDGKIKLEDDKEIDIIKEVEKLAKDSNTEKITIIGHSNGGLLGKVLIDRLKNIGKENLVDKFIMVATPQVGTPKAVAGLLHGSGLSFPFFLNEKTGRGLAENMSSAYNLLPSNKYFDYVQTPVVEFKDDVKEIYDFKEIYGDDIGSKDELDKFLTGDDNKRSDPDFDDTDSPNVLSKELLSQANDIHDNFLDRWQAPENVEIIQIAGWGLDTITGIKYDDCDIIFCPDKLSNLDRELVFKKDGDKTVVVPSAIIMNDGEIYYVNIEKYNKDLKKDFEHANILEISYLQEFIKNILNNERVLSPYIVTVKPEVSEEDESLRYRMHSPVAVHLHDENNNHTGLADNPNPNSDLIYYEENIPNSYYIEFGETKYLGSPKDGNIKVELVGEDMGTFTFEVDELSGEILDKTTTFKDVPVIKDMRASIDISENIGIMEIDWNNDNKIDAIVDVEKSNSTETISLQLLKEIIKSSHINPILKNHFLNELSVAEKQIKKGKNKNTAKILEILEKQIEIFSDKKMLNKLKIDKIEAENLIKIIETIRLNLIK